MEVTGAEPPRLGSRLLLTLPNTDALRGAYADGPQELEGTLQGLGYLPPGLPLPIARMPSLDYAFARERGGEARLDPDAPVARALPRLVLSLQYGTPEEAKGAARGIMGFVPDPLPGRVRPASDAPLATLGLRGSGLAIPALDFPPVFHTRRAAEALVGAPAARAAGLLGRKANLVIADAGLHEDMLRALFPGIRYGGGWGLPTEPPKPNEHGTSVARNAVSLAPHAGVFDLPLWRGPRPKDYIVFTSDAVAAFLAVFVDIWLHRPAGERWVFCNAWGVLDRRLEVPRPGLPFPYSTDARHPLTLLLGFASRRLGHDIVFAAGNGGQFAPDARTGPRDSGPWRSVLGANASRRVLTVGAARADAVWLGYSSQGPGFAAFAEPGSVFPEKPDLCAPSHFVEKDDALWLSSGSSAACGVASGAVAALRSETSPLRALSPARLAGRLRGTARKGPALRAGLGYDIRLGHGILDLGAALGASDPPPTTA